MQKIIKHNWNDRHKLFFTSDLHWNHSCKAWDIPLWKSRGFSSVEESNEYAIAEINRVVPEDGILYNLGDSFLNCSDEQIMDFWPKINCKDVRYIFGNHCNGMYRVMQKAIKDQYGLEGVEVYPSTWQNVTFLGDYQEVKIGKQLLVLKHFPIHSWNGMGKKSIHLHGHQHNADETRNPDSPINRCLDISWDWKKSLWDWDQIQDIMETKTFVSYDHH